MSNNNFTPRLGGSYVRPKKTFTEMLTEEQIESMLEDYKAVDDIYNVPLGTHVRYWSLVKGVKKFRTGGVLAQNKGLPVYVMLSNGKNTWSVQVKDAIFYSKMSLADIKKDYASQITKLEKTVKHLTRENAELKRALRVQHSRSKARDPGSAERRRDKDRNKQKTRDSTSVRDVERNRDKERTRRRDRDRNRDRGRPNTSTTEYPTTTEQIRVRKRNRSGKTRRFIQ